MTTATAATAATGAAARQKAGAGPKQRRFQRFLVGIAMSLVAFVLERFVVRALKRSGGGAVRG